MTKLDFEIQWDAESEKMLGAHCATIYQENQEGQVYLEEEMFYTSWERLMEEENEDE